MSNNESQQRPMKRETTFVNAVRLQIYLNSLQAYRYYVQDAIDDRGGDFGIFDGSVGARLKTIWRENSEKSRKESDPPIPPIGYRCQSPALDHILHRVGMLLERKIAVDIGILEKVEDSLYCETKEALVQLQIANPANLPIENPLLKPDGLEQISRYIRTIDCEYILNIQLSVKRFIDRPRAEQLPFDTEADELFDLAVHALDRWKVQLQDIDLYLTDMLKLDEE